MMGCNSSSNEDKAIIKNAYEALADSDKKTIKDWENAKLENYKSDQDHAVANLKNGASTNIKSMDTYKVTFKVPNSMLGDIKVYIDKKSKDVLGIDLRD